MNCLVQLIKLEDVTETVIVYLGMYFNEPTVEYKESWTSGTATRVPTLYYEGTTKLKKCNAPDYYPNGTIQTLGKRQKI